MGTEMIKQIKEYCENFVLHEGAAESNIRAIYALIKAEEAKQAVLDAENEAIYQSRRASSLVEKIADALVRNPDADEWETAAATVPITVGTEELERLIRKARELNEQREKNSWL